jgi:hypothetical protein
MNSIKMKKTVTNTLVALLLLISLCGHGQTDSSFVKHTVALLKKAYTTQPVEKVYLHLDKPYYAAGDDIWFKGYITLNAAHTPSDWSNVLNVALYDDRGSIKNYIKLPIINGITWGDIALPDTLKEGDYHLVAFTNWMLNYDKKFLFDKALHIGNSITNTVHIAATCQTENTKGQSKFSATLNYSNLDGSPLANKQVAYELQAKYKGLINGKGITNADGSLQIEYRLADTKAQLPDLVKTTINLSEREKINKTVSLQSQAANADLQFFPESGDLISGVSSRVAFKAIGTNGLGVDVKGTVNDNEGNEVARITASHAGMGVFGLTPQSGKTYLANVFYADGSKATLKLPKVLDKGYVLSVYPDRSAENVSIRISTNAATIAANADKELSLLVQATGNIYYAAKFKQANQVYTVSVPRVNFRTGIAQFTLFCDKVPLNERIAFIKIADQLKLAINTNKEVYHTRDKVFIDLLSKSADSLPLQGNFSVAVTDESKVVVDEAEENTILTNLLLTSDLHGLVEKPNYYFLQDDEQTHTDRDILMMTQGYRKFDWKAVLNDTLSTPHYEPEKALSISGRVVNGSGSPRANAKITLFTKASTDVLDTVTNADGRFAFKKLLFPDSTKFVIQSRGVKGADYATIELDKDPFFKVVKSMPLGSPAETALAQLNNDYLLNSKRKFEEDLRLGLGNHNQFLKEVNIKAKKIDDALKFSANLNGPGNADQVVLGDELGDQGGSLTNVLIGKLTGVRFLGDMPVSASNSASRPGVSTPMGVVLDGMTVDYTYLSSLNPSDIGSIEVLKSAIYLSTYGSRAAPGILVITTRHGGNVSYNSKTPGMVTYMPVGYYASRQFYQPKYDAPETNIKMADLRSTIYWKPVVVTDKDGKASFSFYNADAKGTYRVVIEGIDNDGNIGRQVLKYKVE